MRNQDDRVVAVRAFLARSPIVSDPITNELPDAVLDWRRGKVAHPMTKYPEFTDNRSAAIGRDSGTAVVVEVESESGHVGIGITNGGTAAAALVELHLADVVVGMPAQAHETIWDRMYLSTLLYGRKGIVLHAISAVDLALWDLHGQIAQEPVYALLGAPEATPIDVYATGPNPLAIAGAGFWGAKLPLTWGPSEGEQGFRANVHRAQEARDAVGEDFPLAYDCWMALDVDYATRLARAVEPLGFRWLEEPLPPDDLSGLSELRRRMPPGMTLNTGEHEYTSAGFRLLCEAGVDVVQPDPTWCGGITELRRISSVTAAYGKKIIPHVGGVFSYHFLSAERTASLGEFAMMRGLGDEIHPLWDGIVVGEVLPQSGRVHVSDDPGFGIKLAPSVVLDRPIVGDNR